MTADAEARRRAEVRFGGTAKGRPPRDDQRALNEAVTERFIDLAEFIEREIAPGREKSEALTCLKTAKMYAVDAVFTEGIER